VTPAALVNEHGFPTTHDEAWRYTPVDEIVARLEAAAPTSPVPASMSTSLTRAVVDALAGDHGGPRLVFVNGEYAAALSDGVAVASELWCGRLADVAPAVEADRLAAIDGVAPDEFAVRNRAAGSDTAVVLAGTGAQVDAVVHVVHLAVPGERPGASHPRTVVDAGAGSQLTVVETFCGLPGAVVTNASSAVRLGRDAAVTYHRVQVESGDATHVGRTRIDQDAGSRLRATSVMLGADIARAAFDVHLDGADARADLAGLYTLGGHRRHDTVVTVDHAASRCTSTQLFKGIVDDHARGSFSGHVVVRADTSGTDAGQSNHNLLLSPTAQADTRPWLEIFADEVRCVHGATVGRLDDDALFYLRSRGVPLDVARAMLVEAFGREVLDGIEPVSLRDHLVRAAGFGQGDRS
jgi:Fe-S cluster assembly protein SufD